MAETFLFSIAGKLLGELASPALKDIGLFWGVKKELDKLQNTVSTIKAVLLDAEEKQKEDHEVRDWLEKLEDAVYEADDLLDDFSTEGLRRKSMTPNKRANKVRLFFSGSNQLAFRSKMGHRIKVIREKFDAIAADRIKFHFTERREVNRDKNRRRREETHSFVPVEDVVGREEDKNSIIELLLESNVEQNVSIIPIVGIGGIGKTTLAQLVYNDENIQKHFDLRMWVCVSDVFDLKIIAQNIIEAATGKKCNRNQMDGVKDELKREIDGKKYFLVLDDVWNEDPGKWLNLRELLMGGAEGSKILLTARTQLVGKIMGTVSPYLLKGLSESESWSLFKRMAFEHGVYPENPSQVAIGKRIAKKCVGVPLAIRVVGGLLYVKDTEKEWLHFKDYELPMLAQNEIGLFPILKLSYDNLPSDLKRCFSFCSMFPKDHWIDRKTLIQLWIAHGFIQCSEERQHLEDVADQYFMDLLRRSFFQDVWKDGSGNILSCKMHDLIHDLAQIVVGGECCCIDWDTKDVVPRTRHVSVSVALDLSWDIPNRLLEANKLRTFLQYALASEHFDELEYPGDASTWHRAVSNFKHLRALNLLGVQIQVLSSSIGKLLHLRYLDLSRSHFKQIPECICGLLNLQTLKLNDCSFLRELPRDTKNLVNLRHLETYGCYSLSHMPRGFGQLTSLQTLYMFKVGHKDSSIDVFDGGLCELVGLVNIRGALMIKGLPAQTERELPNQFYLVRMEFLETLSLVWDIPVTYGSGAVSADDPLFESLQPHPNLKMLEIKYYRGVSFPSWMMVDTGLSLPNLVKISIVHCHNWQHLTPFGLLPSLQVLKLSFMDSMEYIYDEDCVRSDNYDSSSLDARVLFPSLKMLKLNGLKQLKGFERRRREEVVSRATTSSFVATENLVTSTFGAVRYLTALEKLVIMDCPQLDLSGLEFQSLKEAHFSLLGFDAQFGVSSSGSSTSYKFARV